MAATASENEIDLSGGVNESAMQRGTNRVRKSISEISPTSVPKRHALENFPKSNQKTLGKANKLPVVTKEDEYNVIVTGVKDTGLCGKYWSDMENLPPRRRSTLSKPAHEVAHGPANIACKFCGPHHLKRNGREKRNINAEKESNMCPNKKSSNANKNEPDNNSSSSLSVTTITNIKEDTAQTSMKITETDKQGEKDHEISSKATISIGEQIHTSKNVSCVVNTNSQREIVAKCFAPYDDNSWTSIEQSKGEPLQYAQVLNPPCHIVSMLKLKGYQSMRARNIKSTMIFHVLNGQASIIISNTQYSAQKGDSFYILPKQIYQLKNLVDEETVFSVIQFRFDEEMKTV